VATVLGASLAACGGDDDSSAADPGTTEATTTTSTAKLAGVKDYLGEHTSLLTGFTSEFKADAEHYATLAQAAGYDSERPGARTRTRSARSSRS
jgi:hypothetical protein